jgi:hypothetical protein
MRKSQNRLEGGDDFVLERFQRIFTSTNDQNVASDKHFTSQKDGKKCQNPKIIWKGETILSWSVFKEFSRPQTTKMSDVTSTLQVKKSRKNAKTPKSFGRGRRFCPGAFSKNFHVHKRPKCRM